MKSKDGEHPGAEILSLLSLLYSFTARRVPVASGNHKKEAWYLTSDLLGLGVGGRRGRCCHTEGGVGRKTSLEGINFTFQ